MSNPGNLGQAGFTLLETMIAMAIMLVAFSSILMVENASINTTDKAKQVSVVSMLAKNKMVETEYLMEGHPFADIKTEETGQFQPPFDAYEWKREVKEIVFPELNLATSSGDSNGSADAAADGVSDALIQAGRLVTQFLSQSLREVTVTINWKRGSGKQSYSVTTYWVDLNHEFQLSQ